MGSDVSKQCDMLDFLYYLVIQHKGDLLSSLSLFVLNNRQLRQRDMLDFLFNCSFRCGVVPHSFSSRAFVVLGTLMRSFFKGFSFDFKLEYTSVLKRLASHSMWRFCFSLSLTTSSNFSPFNEGVLFTFQ